MMRMKRIYFIAIHFFIFSTFGETSGWLQLGNTIELDKLTEFQMAFSSDGNRVAIMGSSGEDDNQLSIHNYYDPAIYSFNAQNNSHWEPYADADGDGLLNIYEWTNSVFTLVTNRHSWLSAREDAINRGGHLATISHYSDWEIVRAIASPATNMPGVYGSSEEDGVWLGASDIDLENSWKWVINEPISFTAWSTNTPNGGSTENFLEIGSEPKYRPWDDAAEFWELTYVLEEYDSNWIMADTDGDGLSDGYEKTNSLTRTDRADTDGDGILDPAEINTYGTDPNAYDSDGDGLSDGEEIITFNTDPLIDADADNDGLSDYDEAVVHQTDPNDNDSDGDGLSDYAEVTGDGSYFIANNLTWADAKAYAETLGANFALIKTEEQYTQVTNFLSQFNAPPLNSYVWIGGSYTNNQWLWVDQTEVTASYNAISNLVNSSSNPDTFLTIKASNLTNDNDPLYNIYNDFEQVRSALLYMPGVVTDPNNIDTDNDGLSDYAEINGYGTDPNNPDTDGDQFSDGDEVALNYYTNSTYQAIPGSYTWLQAKWDAHVRGGHIATITSVDEYNVIESLNPGDKFLGGTDEFDEANWRWITSETFNNLGKWALGQPDNSGNGQNYLRITDDSPPYNYQLDDCDNHEAFVSGYILEIPHQNPAIHDAQVYQLITNVDGNGQVDPIGSNTYASNSTVVITATPQSGSLFIGWSGDLDLDYQSASHSIVIQSNMNITAEFSEDADNDSLTNNEEILIGTDPRSADTDGDGLNDDIENSMSGMTFNFDPTVTSSDELERLQSALNSIPGMMDEQIIEYRSGNATISVEGDNVLLRLPFEASTNSGMTWYAITNIVEMILPADKDVEFFEMEFE